MGMTRIYWHVHHEELWEPVGADWADTDGARRDYIVSDKRANEIQLRLQLMRAVDGPLPERLQTRLDAFNAATAAVATAQDAYYTAYNAIDGDPSYDDLRRAYYEATDAVRFAKDAMHAVMMESRVRTEMERLHLVDCYRECPFDGVSIFPETRDRSVWSDEHHMYVNPEPPTDDKRPYMTAGMLYTEAYRAAIKAGMETVDATT